MSKTTLERTSDREVVITRTFRAPAAIVFDAYTKPEYVSLWWAPRSRRVTVAECQAEVRVGGGYRYVIARSETERFVFYGKYLEIARPTRLVYTQTFEPFPDAALGRALRRVGHCCRGNETEGQSKWK